MKRMLWLNVMSFLIMVACGTPSTSVVTSMDNTWDVVFPNTNREAFQFTSLSLTQAEQDVGIDVVYAISENINTIGYAFQATVDGDGGVDSVVFRLTILEQAFLGFSVISHREHTNFGVKQLNALTAQLPGTTVDFALVVAILVNANAGRTGISATYDGLMPAIEQMTLRSL